MTRHVIRDVEDAPRVPLSALLKDPFNILHDHKNLLMAIFNLNASLLFKTNWRALFGATKAKEKEKASGTGAWEEMKINWLCENKAKHQMSSIMTVLLDYNIKLYGGSVIDVMRL